MVELWPGKNYPRTAIQAYVTITDFKIVAGKNYPRPCTYCWHFGVENLFWICPSPYSPQIVNEKFSLLCQMGGCVGNWNDTKKSLVIYTAIDNGKL